MSKSTKYCAFLRGVNVKGTNMKMKDVCTVFQNAKMQKVSSVLSTGNILFESDQNNKELQDFLEKELSSAFQYDAHLFILDLASINEIIKAQPFNICNDYHIYCFIGNKDIGLHLLNIFNDCKVIEGEQGLLINDFFYWQVPKNSTLDSQFSKVLSDKKLKSKFTSRNFNTIIKVLDKMT